MLSRIKPNWELFKITDSDIKGTIKYSEKISCSGLWPQIQFTEAVVYIWKSPLNKTTNMTSGNSLIWDLSKGKTDLS